MSDLPTATAAPSSVPGADQVLTSEALQFVAGLQRRFGACRDELLAARQDRYAETARTGRIEFAPETADIRSGDWTVAAAPEDLRDRRVEITGPPDPKMAINAMSSGARVWLAVPVIRPRGWQRDERLLQVDGRPAVGALVDFGLYFLHNAAELLARGSGPYFYLPKLESYLEARLWADVFAYSEAELGLPHGVVRATVLIGTIPAAFQMNEILFELREYASGLNAGRWDNLFSIIKNFRECGGEFVLPDRNSVSMTAPFMRAYTELLVTTCHRRGAFAIGGMAAFIPSRRDPAVNETALAKVRQDKEREAADGFDGSWVAHPGLVQTCRQVFDEALGRQPNQLERRREVVPVSADDLLDLAATPGTRTEAGLRNAVAVGLRYLGAWLGGSGAVAIFNLMEDAATAEISRSQVWQWLRNEVVLEGGRTVDRELVSGIIDEELATILAGVEDPDGHFEQAAVLFRRLVLDPEYVDLLTVAAYDLVD